MGLAYQGGPPATAHKASLHPACALPDSRPADFARAGKAPLIVEDASFRRWGDARPALARLASEMARRGRGLLAGDWASCGMGMVPPAGQPGGRVRAEVSPLGVIENAPASCHADVTRVDEHAADGQAPPPVGFPPPVAPRRLMAQARGFHLLVAAQFCSALADNALLIVAMAWLQALQMPPWWAPLLKFSFTIAYVVLAPGVGVLADRWPKARLMMAMNALKVVGVLLLLADAHPLLAMAVVGIGAAAYAPAKYGLVTELVGAEHLVAANGWIEVTTVCAVLLGTVLGGVLVSPALAARAVQSAPQWPALPLATGLLLLLYGLAAALNLGVPDSGARYARRSVQPRALWRGYWRAHRRLWADARGGLSLAVTTLFWGVAAVLQFAVLRWADETLGLPLDRAAYLQGVVAVGIVAGAAVAGRCVPLAQATRVLPLGMALGLLVPVVALVHNVWAALPLLWLVGALGGALVVPLNALLQHRGHQLLSAGRSIAVQNFNENASVLVMLAVYATLLAAQWDIRLLMSALGLLVAASVAALWVWDRHQVRWMRAA